MRMLWVILSPAVWVLNRVGIIGYRWVNRCALARRRDLGDALMHHEWFGDAVRVLPDSVVLCGIQYRTAWSDGLVTFVEEHGLLRRSRISFRRDDQADFLVLWEVETNGAAIACHVEAAYRWVRAVFGDEHTVARPTNAPRPGGKDRR